MALENANIVHAHGTFRFSAAGPQETLRNYGFEGIPVRSVAGLFELTLDEEPGGLQTVGAPITNVNWFPVVSVLFQTGLTTIFQAYAVVDNVNPRLVRVFCFDAAGVAADAGVVSVTLFRLPTNT